jgi:uncharacterized protein (UPF0261 family)
MASYVPLSLQHTQPSPIAWRLLEADLHRATVTVGRVVVMAATAAAMCACQLLLHHSSARRGALGLTVCGVTCHQAVQSTP